MRLNDYLLLEEITQREFGEQLDPPVSQGLVYQWICGRTRVTLHYALQIQEKTRGKVSPQDCADMYKGVKKRLNFYTNPSFVTLEERC